EKNDCKINLLQNKRHCLVQDHRSRVIRMPWLEHQLVVGFQLLPEGMAFQV
ncbi:hypothetical protein CCACVL1_08492, partial [Corchorus capsularis]